jgi:hypothetical protein
MTQTKNSTGSVSLSYAVLTLQATGTYLTFSPDAEMSDIGYCFWLRCVDVEYAPVACRVGTADESETLPVLF